MTVECSSYHEEVSWCLTKSSGSSTYDAINSTWEGQALWREGDMGMTGRVDMEEGAWKVHGGATGKRALLVEAEQEYMGDSGKWRISTSLTHPSEWDRGTFKQHNSSIITEFVPRSSWKNGPARWTFDLYGVFLHFVVFFCICVCIQFKLNSGRATSSAKLSF